MPGGKSKATHFLCFPIASPSTVPALSESIAHFRNIATKPEKSQPRRRLVTGPDGRVIVATDHEGHSLSSISEDPLGNLSRPVQDSEASHPDIQILPSICHRPAGTYHLTLGTMDLSEPDDMTKARTTLQDLDLRQLLRKAGLGPPPESKDSRTWRDDDSDARDHTTKTEKVTRHKQNTSDTNCQVGETQPTEVNDIEKASNDIVPLYISLQGLGAFPSAERARVIWARPSVQLKHYNKSSQIESSRLHNFALHISQTFRDVGLINETRPLTLHATVSNLRYAVQAKGGRTSKGRAWKQSRWQDGQVNAHALLNIFNRHKGDIANWQLSQEGSANDSVDCDETEDEHETMEALKESFVWVKDVIIDRVAICKLGSTKHDDGLWGEWYPPIEEKIISQKDEKLSVIPRSASLRDKAQGASSELS